jgi:hypothetical protein
VEIEDDAARLRRRKLEFDHDAARRSHRSNRGRRRKDAGPVSAMSAAPSRWRRRVRLMLDTGFPQADVENDFLRARRRQFLATLAYRLRGRRGDSNRLMLLDDVVGPLGWRGQRQLGLQTIQLDTIVGTAGSRRDFDRRFRPTSTRVRDRWERVALAQRRGEAIPPIEVYRVGCVHFVADGHHRVSIAAAARQRLIDAYVTQVRTAAPPWPTDVLCPPVHDAGQPRTWPWPHCSATRAPTSFAAEGAPSNTRSR